MREYTYRDGAALDGGLRVAAVAHPTEDAVLPAFQYDATRAEEFRAKVPGAARDVGGVHVRDRDFRAITLAPGDWIVALPSDGFPRYTRYTSEEFAARFGGGPSPRVEEPSPPAPTPAPARQDALYAPRGAVARAVRWTGADEDVAAMRAVLGPDVEARVRDRRDRSKFGGRPDLAVRNAHGEVYLRFGDVLLVPMGGSLAVASYDDFERDYVAVALK